MNKFTPINAPLNILIKCAAKATGISPEEVLLKTRKRPIVTARQLIMMYMLANYGRSTRIRQIGGILGGKNHASVIHSRRIYFQLLECRDKKLLKSLDVFKTNLLCIDPRFSINMNPPKKIINNK